MDSDGENYAGIQGMSAETDDEAADCPVPEEDSDSDSDEEMASPQVAAADDHEDAVPGGAGGVVRPRDDADSDVASDRDPG